MQDIIDTEPEEILIIGNTHSPARLGKGIHQIPLDRTVRIRNRRIIKVTAYQDIISFRVLNLF